MKEGEKHYFVLVFKNKNAFIEEARSGLENTMCFHKVAATATMEAKNKALTQHTNYMNRGADFICNKDTKANKKGYLKSCGILEPIPEKPAKKRKSGKNKSPTGESVHAQIAAMNKRLDAMEKLVKKRKLNK